MNLKYAIIAISATVLLMSGCSTTGDSMMGKDGMMMKDNKMMPPFGGPKDVAYAQGLWVKMQKMGFNTLKSNLYVGSPPHGVVIEVLEGKIDGNKVIVKRNYLGDGLAPSEVEGNRAKYLTATTVMVKRVGYDTDNQDWFWAKYKPNGEIMKNPKGMKLAGKIAKGKTVGCIACHSNAPGNDYMYNQDKGKMNPKATLIDSMKM